jgi:hypothetical protein
MKPLNLNDVVKYVETNIGTFHTKRLESLNELKLPKILKRKNPYLFKAKNVLAAHDIVKLLLDAHLSSQEETIFGEFLEQLAVFICGKVYGGTKSAAEGIDLEFEKDNVRYIVTVKSGPHWANSGQIKQMKQNFQKAKRILRTNSPGLNIIGVNGCCYGRSKNRSDGEYVKLSGQRFWEFISGDTELYTKIIEPLGHKAKEKNEQFFEVYNQIINKFTVEFSKDFCDEGKINWERLVHLSSAFRTAEKPDKGKRRTSSSKTSVPRAKRNGGNHK